VKDMARSPIPAKTTKPAIIERADNVFNDLNLVAGSIKKNSTGITVSGVDRNNQAVTIHGADYHGYREQRITSFQGTTDDRKKVAKELRNQGLSQATIADRLGVSQKTISNDLRD
jgi:DNA-binding NarL/FixJ family response regulator